MSGSAEGATVGREAQAAVTLDGDGLRGAFEAATRCLERQRDAINALNVFPVPDGDTGTNMLLTMRAINEEALRASDSSVGAVAAAMARGALLGARGNSGVILSQFFHGMAQGLQGKDELDGGDLVRAFARASEAAYGSVSVPVDGTMLTVMRELSVAASESLGSQEGASDVPSIWRVSLNAAKEALSRTPLQLPVLREAGVVDAGGQGFVTLLEGARCFLAGEDVDSLQLLVCAPVLSDTVSGEAPRGEAEDLHVEGIAVHEDYLTGTEGELYGYCTQLLIHGQELDLGGIRGKLASLADSTVVVGDGTLVKVHVHASDPGPVVSYAISLGSIDQVSITDMDRQHREFIALHRGQPDASAVVSTAEEPASSTGRDGAPGGVSVSVVAVASGDGFVELLKGLGCESIVTGGQTMNPSAQELLKAAQDTGASNVILLPNNPNVIPAARQAASIASESSDPASSAEADSRGGMRLHVVDSRTIPQGICALLAMNPEGDLDGNLTSMAGALATVKTIEVTRAVRSATLGGIAVGEGQHIGLVDGELVVATDSAVSALVESIVKAGSSAVQLVTLYWGGDVQEGETGKAADALRGRLPEVEVVYGGQPYYQYIASLE